jgi:hypothetical protein
MMPRKQPSLDSKESACLASFRFRCWNRSSLFLGYLGWDLGEPYHAIAKGIDKVDRALSRLTVGADFRFDSAVTLKGKRKNSEERLKLVQQPNRKPAIQNLVYS